MSILKGIGKLASGAVGAVGDAASAVGGAVGSAANAVGGAASDAANAVGGAVSDAASAVGSAASDAATAVAGAAVATAKTVANVAEGAVRVASDAATFAATLPRGAYNLASDTVTRTYFLATGQLNMDIISGGTQLEKMSDLLPGDILLKQGGVEVTQLLADPLKEGKELVSLVIDGVQIVTNRSGHKYVGAGLLGHAAVYIGSGELAEAIGGGAQITKLDGDYNSKFNFYAVRFRDERIRQVASELARKYAGSGRIGYAFENLPGAIAPKLATDELLEDPTTKDRRTLDQGGKTSMYCSEFVAFVLNCATDDLGRQRLFTRRQHRFSPEEMYVELRDHSECVYLGELHKGVRGNV